jgi:phosphoribosylanthranilate isomerase
MPCSKAQRRAQGNLPDDRAMAKVKVKICGITNWPDAQRACAEGADFLGFNFYRRSPRYVAPERARKIIKRLPRGVAAVGVFVNEDQAKLLEIAHQVGLDYVQMHGEENAMYVEQVEKSLPVIRAIRVNGNFRPGMLARYRHAAAILLDGFDPRLRGGTGKTFDWRIARACTAKARVFLAGGLSPENVRDAIRSARPYAVDVCSGVEARPGKKDTRKLKRLMREIRAAEKGIR